MIYKLLQKTGNLGLCGLPLKPCVEAPKLSTASKVIVGISLAATLAATVAAVVILTTRKRLPAPEDGPSVAHLKTPPRDELHGLEKGSSPAESVSPECPTPPPTDGKRPEQSMKLSFLVEDGERFDLNDLLKASAEVVGGGVFGSTYRASLGRGRTVAVKRFKHMNNVGREDFHEHMRRLGRLSHRNLLAVVAFHYRKEEKLLVSDFAPNLSLAFHLHGNSKCSPTGCGSRRPLDWATRLKVVKGVARGLCHLYAELPSLTAPHGHLKSSNVLLDASFEPLLNDYGLLPVVNGEHARKHVVAYKSPEYREGRRITRKTDVWALGILILEVLTGKDGGELGAWVESSCAAASGEGAEVVFDEGLVSGGGGEEWCGEMRKLWGIGMRCCEVDVEKRWDIKEAVKSIEELKESC